MTSNLLPGARFGAAIAALGFWAALPHAAGIASADTADGAGSVASAGSAVSASAGPRARSQAPVAAAENTVRRSRTARAAVPVPDAANRGPARAAAGAVPVRRPAARAAGSAGAVRASSASVVQAPDQTGPEAPAVASAAPLTVQPAAATASATEVGPFGSVRTALLSVIDLGLNWISGLPGGPVADLLSGALLLVRRALEPATPVTVPLRPTPISTVATFVVSNLADSGTGSLRQAILDANAAAGADAITFSVSGVIRVGDTALPSITDTVVIDGATAPGYVGAPLVQIDFDNTAGLTLAQGASGSQILSLALVDASGAGVTIAASGTTLAGNYIGIWGDGVTRNGNHGDGILLQAGASGNRIGIGSTDSFVLSNVISGNGGNGITFSGASDNIVQANYIGTDYSGTYAIGNRGQGILLTAGAANNLIGGLATGGNDPTNGVFVRPPQGNLISGNRSTGVLINDGATENQLSGNYIGTGSSGLTTVSNIGDGVTIKDADYNLLIGTTSEQNPFVYYNVISGNRGNGLTVTNSDHTVVHANFFGLGSDDATAVANYGDGMLVNGDSQQVDSGGEIPLGNVMSGNRGYGLEIAGTAGGVVSFNNFVGMAAFGGAVPNWKSGIRVTSSNPNFDPNDQYSWNRIRTTLVGGNWGNGIEFFGNAYGAEVTDTAVGTTSSIRGSIPNRGNGIVVGGNASHIAIGGFQPSVEEAGSNFSVYSGSNGGYGIVFQNNAHDCYVFDTRVGIGGGAELFTATQLPNGKGGILVDRGTSNIQIGGQRDAVNPGLRYFNEIGFNDGAGITARFTDGLKLLGNTIAKNTNSGVVLNGATNTVVGVPLAGNTIIENGLYGLYAVGDLDGSTVESSTISRNGYSGVRLTWARGITVGATDLTGANTIAENTGYGIVASGWSRGSAIAANNVADNGRGNTNTRWAWGLTTLPQATVVYAPTSTVNAADGGVALPVAGWQGLTGGDTAGEYLFSGTTQAPDGSGTAGLLYVGPINTQGGAGYVMVMPDQPGQTTANTTNYSTDNLGNGQLRIVGTFSNASAINELSFIYTGTVGGVGTASNYVQMPFPTQTATWNVAHSTSGGLVVGDYDSSTIQGRPAGGGRAYIYDAVNQTYLVPSMIYPGSAANTAYGIWWNGGTSYTIAGGYSNNPINNLENPNVPLSEALLVDFDSSTGQFSNWKSFRYTNPVTGFSGITHFEGISGVQAGTYTLAATAIDEGIPVAGFVTVTRNADGSFGDMRWTSLDPGTGGSPFADSVYGNAVVGISPSSAGINPYQALILP